MVYNVLEKTIARKYVYNYVEFQYSELKHGRKRISNVDSRNVYAVINSMPKESVGFRFFNLEETFSNGRRIISQQKNYSGWIYVDGIILSLEKAKSTKDKKHLVEIMEMHEWDNVLITRNGNVVPFNQTDMVISTINRR